MERFRAGSRTAATSKIECFVVTVNGFQPLTIITKRSILDVAAVLDPPLRFTPKHYLRSLIGFLIHRILPGKVASSLFALFSISWLASLQSCKRDNEFKLEINDIVDDYLLNKFIWRKNCETYNSHWGK